MADLAVAVFGAVGVAVMMVVPTSRIIVRESLLHPRSTTYIYLDEATGKLVGSTEPREDGRVGA